MPSVQRTRKGDRLVVSETYGAEDDPIVQARVAMVRSYKRDNRITDGLTTAQLDAALGETKGPTAPTGLPRPTVPDTLGVSTPLMGPRSNGAGRPEPARAPVP